MNRRKKGYCKPRLIKAIGIKNKIGRTSEGVWISSLYSNALIKFNLNIGVAEDFYFNGSCGCSDCKSSNHVMTINICMVLFKLGVGQ